ncbi:MAG: cysteine desulfurase [Rectinema sp.]|nr:cysteine desulfurase [Rectinema sp.]
MIEGQVYLDWAATALPDAAILRQAMELSLTHFGNPSSAHQTGRNAREILEAARNRLATSLGLDTLGGTIVFTASGTEADQIPFLSLLRAMRALSLKKTHIIVSAIEHATIECQAAMLQRMGLEVTWVVPDSSGHIHPDSITSRLRKETALIAVMAVNNETGAVQDISGIARAIAESAHAKGMKKPWFHTDAVQASGKLPLAAHCHGADSIAISAHKIRGPKGIGGLWLSRKLEPLACGGGQENGIRSGTENVLGAVAFSFAAEAAIRDFESRRVHALALESQLLQGIASIPGACTVPNRKPADPSFVPDIVSIAFPGLGGETMVRALSDAGISVSTGSACSSNKMEKGRRVLKAMGVPDDISFSSIRVSTGPTTTAQEIDYFLQRAEDLYRRLKT